MKFINFFNSPINFFNSPLNYAKYQYLELSLIRLGFIFIRRNGPR